MEEEIKVDNDGICINETPIVKPGIYFDGVKITTAEEWDKAIEEFRKRANDFIPKQKVRDKIELFELEIETLKTLYPKSYTRDDDYKLNVFKICILKELLEEEK